MDIKVYAIYVVGDTSHAVRATHSIEIPSAATFMDIDALIGIAQKYRLDAIHPEYGFLSESEVFAHRMWDEANAMVLGPGPGILSNTGDKLKARQLAEQCSVPVSPALAIPTDNVETIRNFAAQVGYPIMIKAVDGGGGRGIRLVRSEEQLASSCKRAVEESPSKRVFAEKAAIHGFRHIEIQIVGDGTGNVTHLWERECSIQRRYQKIVEIAPSIMTDRQLIAEVIIDALKLAAEMRFFSLGTFEFLVSTNPVSKEYYFLEINPRLQVEHTVTECISMTDLVKTQLLLAQGASLADCGLPNTIRNPAVPPAAHSIQLRITAEDVQKGWSLSIGKISSSQMPSGNGIRVETHLMNGHPTVVSADFDSLICKLIVTAPLWPDAVRKAQIALADTQVLGVKTNIGVLRAIVAHPDFVQGGCDTQWLESRQQELLDTSLNLSSVPVPVRHNMLGSDETWVPTNPGSSLPFNTTTTPSTLFRKGDAWSLGLVSPPNKHQSPTQYHVELTQILRNDFPTSLSANIRFSNSSSATPYTLTLRSTSASASAALSQHPRSDPSDPSHISIPFPGKLVELVVNEGDSVKEGDVVCVVQQMKMELEVRASRSGRVQWVMDIEDGEEVAEGMLAAIVERESDARL
ncbi:hypothetical protein ACEQ8H_008782 [Pleosporales sp. CAS-2024a]